MDGHDNSIITIVSGLPRSGTSLMMKMLQAGAGIEPLVDNIRKADEDNPKGYFEDERVKKLKDDNSWLDEARGKILKVVSMLLFHLPDDFHYQLVFMQRNLQEVMASQKKMLERRNEKPAADDRQMLELYEKHLDHVYSFLAGRKNMSVCYVSFNNLFSDPDTEIERLQALFPYPLNRKQMLVTIDPKLYRKKAETGTFQGI